MTAVLDPAAELDAACARMAPIARRFTAAVRDRDQAAVAYHLAEARAVPVPAGWTAVSVLAVVLADQNAAAVISERDRCRGLAAQVLDGPVGGLAFRARRLPARIASGDRP